MVAVKLANIRGHKVRCHYRLEMGMAQFLLFSLERFPAGLKYIGKSKSTVGAIGRD